MVIWCELYYACFVFLVFFFFFPAEDGIRGFCLSRGLGGVYKRQKGGGSENKSKMTMLSPSDSVVYWQLKTVPTMGAGWCPPGMLGIGIGVTAEKAAILAKKSLMDLSLLHI